MMNRFRKGRAIAARKRRDVHDGPGSGDWLASCAGALTVLLTFFALMLSMSSIDAGMFNRMARTFAGNESSGQILIRGQTDGSGQIITQPSSAPQVSGELEDLADSLNRMLEEEENADLISVSLADGFVLIRFMDDILFEPNSSILKTQDRVILDFIGFRVKQIQDDSLSIQILGHTAPNPDQQDSPESDRILSAQRANAVLDYFENEIGVDPLKMIAAGYGRWKPLPEYADNATEESRRKNRRLEILISNQGNSLSKQLDNIYEKLVE